MDKSPAEILLKSLEDEYLISQGIISTFVYHQTGSRYICDPPVLDTDDDWIVLVEDEKMATIVYDTLEAAEYHYSEDQAVKYGECISFRKDAINIIVCRNPSFYFHWVCATEICKLLNIQDKDLRKKIHRINCGEDL